MAWHGPKGSVLYFYALGARAERLGAIVLRLRINVSRRNHLRIDVSRRARLTNVLASGSGLCASLLCKSLFEEIPTDISVGMHSTKSSTENPEFWKSDKMKVENQKRHEAGGKGGEPE